MKGAMLTIAQDGKTTFKELNQYLDYDDLHKGVGGYLELVPFFDSITWNNELHKCLVFCDEEGKLKNKKHNATATQLWMVALRRNGKFVGIRPKGKHLIVEGPPDHLVGDIVVVWGDFEFMESL